MADYQKHSIFRIAFASSDGYVVDEHFGRASAFYIYQFFEDEYTFIEKRTVNPVCIGGSHSDAKMQQTVSQLTDCKYVVALRIGMGASAAMQQKGITPMALPGEITDALDKIYSYNEIQNLF